jgi:ubiquinone/menaquinone biosynthesis C-methylase UbiE
MTEDTDYVLGHDQRHYQQLVEQDKILGPSTERMLGAAGIHEGMRVVDVGCGVGNVTLLLSRFVGPKGSVVGVDIDSGSIDVARGRAISEGLTNCEFRVEDARTYCADPLFDAAVGRLVLMYTSDPTAALRNIAERVRPGGVVAFQELDQEYAGMSWESTPLFAQVRKMIVGAFKRSGARTNLGTELFERMRDAGLEPDPSPIAEMLLRMGQSAFAVRRWVTTVRGMLPRMIDYGIATEAEVDIDTLERRLLEEAARTGVVLPLWTLLVSQWARKPDDGLGN